MTTKQQTIWKFTLTLKPEQTIEIPHTHEYLSIQMQAGQPCLWAIVDPAANTKAVRIACHPTGGIGAPARRDGHEYLGTVQVDWTVWHFFGYAND